MDDRWDPDSPVNRLGPNRATFGCRVGPVDGRPSPACSLVAAAATAPADPFYGRKLTREEALRHQWLEAYWEIVDHILEHDPTGNGHFTG